MGWSYYHVYAEATFVVDCHGGETEREQEALFAEAKARLQAAWAAAGREIEQDPRYAVLTPEVATYSEE